MSVLDDAIDVRAINNRVPGRKTVTYDYEHPETGWRSKQVAGVWAEGWFLCPADPETGIRIPMLVSTVDHDKTDRYTLQDGPVIVTDLLREKQYRVTSEPCGLGCHCDASAVEVED